MDSPSFQNSDDFPLSSPDSLPQTPSTDVITSDTSSVYKKEAGVPKGFHIPTSWRADIMDCIKEKELTAKARNALVRDLVVHMYSFANRPSKQFCEYAARRLTVMYPFMRDALGTGYVSLSFICVLYLFNECMVLIFTCSGFLGEAYCGTYLQCAERKEER